MITLFRVQLKVSISRRGFKYDILRTQFPIDHCAARTIDRTMIFTFGTRFLVDVRHDFVDHGEAYVASSRSPHTIFVGKSHERKITNVVFGNVIEKVRPTIL